ncbi:hypothetical protein J2D73_05860 [Acetobacter sacchari]|uniref:Mannosyltransferase n=1 Tax=Acetobacter sacchari TaxID=2661687 RepID=A0ABS3LTT1_9PROT|nr:hypothetical protein [Acetobacter sacchari]
MLAVLYPGGARADEIFQYLEPALRRAGHHAVTTWDWREGIRSWLVPGAISKIIEAEDAFGFAQSPLIVRILFSIASLMVVAVFLLHGWLQDQKRGLWLCGVAAALWPDIACAGFRTLGETLGGNFLATGVILANITAVFYKDASARRVFILLASSSMLLGAATAVRFQFGPAALFAIGLTTWQLGLRRSFLPLVVGFLPPIALLGLVDGLTLSYPFQSIFHNYYVNSVMGVADTFGCRSPFFYLYKITTYWGAATVPVFFLASRTPAEARSPLLSAIFLILYHSAIPHKEASFIYPATPLLILCAAASLTRMLRVEGRIVLRRAIAAEIFTCVSVFISTFAPHMKEKSDPIKLQMLANKKKDMCGLAIFNTDKTWGTFGGYSYMRSGKALYLFTTPAEVSLNAGRYDYLLGKKTVSIFENGFKIVSCHDQFCLYRTGASCDDTPDYDQFSKKLRSLESPHI